MHFTNGQTILAAGINANGLYIIYARAVVESENKDAWVHFLHLKLAMPQILEASLTSDRDEEITQRKMYWDRMLCVSSGFST